MNAPTLPGLTRIARVALTVLLALALLAMGALGSATPAEAAERGKRSSKSATNLAAGDEHAAPEGPGLQRRPVPAKPAHAAVGKGQSRTQLHLKLAEGLSGRVRGGGLASIKAGENLDPVAGVLKRHRARTTPLFSAPERVLAEEKVTLERRSGKQLADLNLYFRVTLPEGSATERVIDELNATDLVEIAYAEPLPVAPPSITTAPMLTAATSDFTYRQGYRGAAPDGIDALYAGIVAGGRGGNAKVVDIEYAWNQYHEDLAAIRGRLIPNGTPTDPWNSDDHGTAVMGELVGTDNGFGVTGIVPDAAAGMVNASNTGGYNLANAIWVAQNNTAPGDVILLEQQISGPNHRDATDVGLVPVEWYQGYFDAIARATAAGRIVVEAAGNGYQNLDGAEYGRAFDRTYRDSGAIMVGAGAGGTCGAYNQPARGRLSYSNYGSRLDVQGWGGCVTTSGYGALQGGDRNAWYTHAFNGTSSASPIVAGAAVSLSSIAQQRGLAAPTSTQMRTLLQYGATPQTTTNALTGKIGPLPNLRNAITAIGGGATPCTDDAHEPNDSRAAAASVAFGQAVNGTVCPGNLDLFAITAQAGDEVTVDLTFAHAAGDLDVSLHSADGTRIAIAETTTDNERLTATLAASGTHYIMVYGYEQATNTYRLVAAGGGGPTGCTDDAMEPNDSMAESTPLDFGAETRGVACPNNIDLFEVDLAAGETIAADVTFTHADGDLDVSLHGADGTRLALADSTTDNERLEFTVTTAGPHFLQVYGYQGSSNDYVLTAGRVPAMLQPVSSLSAKAGLRRATLAWTLPAGAAGVDVRMAQGSTPPGPHAGTSVYRGAASQFTKRNLATGTAYAFAVYTVDAAGNVGPGRSVVLRGTSLAASAPTSVRKGSVARVRGVLKNAAGGAALANRTVVLYQRKPSGTSWNRVAAKKTSSTGVVVFGRTPRTTMKYQLRFTGKGRHLGSVSTVVTVRVS